MNTNDTHTTSSTYFEGALIQSSCQSGETQEARELKVIRLLLRKQEKAISALTSAVMKLASKKNEG